MSDNTQDLYNSAAEGQRARAMVKGHNVFMRKLSVWISKHLSQKQFVLILAFIVGVGAAVAAQILKLIIHEIEYLLTAQFDVTHSNWLFLVYPVVGIYLTALFIRYIVRDDIGHGVTKILYALSRKQGNIRGHNCWSSVVASALTIGFGGIRSCGRYIQSSYCWTDVYSGSAYGRSYDGIATAIACKLSYCNMYHLCLDGYEPNVRVPTERSV